jgi:acetoin utilization deacetylase AcuC-like enzyme
VLPFKLIYHDGYDLNLGAHVFPSRKFGMIRERLLAEGVAEAADFVEPEAASDQDMLRVHSREWIGKLQSGFLDYLELATLEIPYSRKMVDAFWLATGGTILAARLAMRDGIGFNLGGGFHHAYPNHGEGFCAVNDIAVGIRAAQAEGLAERAMVIDADVHHGNGTAAIFAGDASVYTLSIHQFDNYPSHKPPSTVDIHLPDGVGDEGYLARLGDACRAGLAEFKPQLVMYVAGADPYREDKLGGLSLTMAGLAARDRMVLEMARGAAAGVAVVLAGGYAREVEDTVAIHCNTVRAAAEACHN